MELVLTVVVVALVFEYINGFHDTANSIATVVSTKVLTPRQAILLASCTNLFGALFLAVSKRQREIVNAGAGATQQRAVLAAYTPELLDRMLTIAAASTLMSYALYTIWPTTVAKFGTEQLIVTVPVVAYGVLIRSGQ